MVFGTPSLISLAVGSDKTHYARVYMYISPHLSLSISQQTRDLEESRQYATEADETMMNSSFQGNETMFNASCETDVLDQVRIDHNFCQKIDDR